MVSMVDRQVGEVLALLAELGIDDDTLVFFSGDNGGADYFTTPDFPRGIHGANRHPRTGVEFRGKKGELYEGGLRIPFLARWPGMIPPGRVSEHLGSFPDVLPTIAEVAGATPPAGIDGLSLVPELLGPQAAGRSQPRHEYLYWEINGWTAIRQGTWRAVKRPKTGAWELYELAADPSESRNVAADHPQVLARLTALAAAASEPAREGTFSRTNRHERDRRAKSGKHDQPDHREPPPEKKPRAKARARATGA
jgi:arylsulfatase A-like enzyme